MLVYGDAQVTLAREEVLRALDEAHDAVAEAAEGTLQRHAALVARLLVVGEVAQALLDAVPEAPDGEPLTPATEATHALLLAAGRPVVASFFGASPARLDPHLCERLRAELPEALTVKLPEGYAHYAVYLEGYIAAARTLRGLGPRPQVVGLRSIGTSLGAVVAATLEGALTTLRPRGPPFARTVHVSSTLEARLQLGPAGSVVLVDEGPGISGSSFGGTADWFEARGVRDLAFLPSHRGSLGEVASSAHRARWERARRPVVGFDEVFARAGSRFPLAGWFEDLTGPAESLEPLPGDGWRRRLLAADSPGAPWPPVHPQQERPKYLLRAGARSYLVKFAGLGRSSRGFLERAQKLADGGFVPRVAALRHGFLLGPWHQEGRPLCRSEPWKRPWVETLAGYLAARSRMAAPRRGASVPQLLEMARVNTRESLGADAARSPVLEPPDLAALAGRARPIDGDKKMQPWEWLLLPGGRLLKCDALDHLEGHDLLGPQDLAWDLAGALGELDFDAAQQGFLLTALTHHGVTLPSASDLRFYRAAYLAFAVGHATFALAACGDPRERPRWKTERDRYGALLEGVLRTPP